MARDGLRTKAFVCLHRKSRWELDAMRREFSIAKRALDEVKAEIRRLKGELAQLNQRAAAQVGPGSFMDPLSMDMADRYHRELSTLIQHREKQRLAREKLVETCRKGLAQAHKKEKYLENRVSELRRSDDREVQRKQDIEFDDLFLARRR